MAPLLEAAGQRPTVLPPRDLHRDPSVRAAGGRDLSSHGARRRRRGIDLSAETGMLREAFRAHGLNPDDPSVRELVDRGIAPIGGAATGRQGATYMHNLPPEGSYVMNSDLFFRETERNDVPQEQKAYPGLGGAPVDQRIPNVGILTGIRLVFTGQLVVAGGGTVTATQQWPFNVLKRFTLNANGQTSLIACEGNDLRARRQRIFRNPTDPVTTAPATSSTTKDPAPGVISNGTYPVVLVWDVPIVHNSYSLTGALFAQSDQIYLSWRGEWAPSADLFTLGGGSTATLTGSIKAVNTFYDVPFADTKEGRKVLIPDLQWLHGYVSADQPFANTGAVATPFIRTSGQLLTYTWSMLNGPAAVISPLAVNEYRFKYGGNRVPRVYNPPAALLEKNAQDYNGLIMPNAGVAVLDFEVDNPARDIVYPKGVVELAMEADVPSSVSLNPNCRVHFIEETLFAGGA